MYYHEHSRGIVFASHIDGIVSRGSGFQLDEEYIADYLCYGDHHGERTPYAEIRRLTPGTSISIAPVESTARYKYTHLPLIRM